MNTQYTVRNVPRQLDITIRKRAKIEGTSINDLLLRSLAEANGYKLSEQKDESANRLDWFIGKSNIGDDVIRALEDDDKLQKELMRNDS